MYWSSRVSMLAGLFSILFVGACSPGEPEGAESVDATPETGLQLFSHYCASCHGALGLGDGPVARSLNPPPADLTTLAQRNDGVFDAQAVLSTIDGRREVIAHGPRDMPVWGVVFASEHAGAGTLHAQQHAALLSKLLTDYVESLQKE